LTQSCYVTATILQCFSSPIHRGGQRECKRDANTKNAELAKNAKKVAREVSMAPSTRIVWGTALLVHLAAPTALAQERSTQASALQQLNASVASMVGSVSRSVVQVVVTSSIE
jgi:hypothetical protein